MSASAAVKASPITVRKVDTPQDFKAFFEFPWTLYKNDPNWVPPLLSTRQKMLDKAKNPEWEYMAGDYFVAWRGEKPVGTIAAFVNHQHNKVWNEQIGWFGFFECDDDPEAAKALLIKAAEHVKTLGPVTKLRGPANFTINDECGLLIENFSLPVILMPYNPPYYQKLIEGSGLGFEKAMDTASWYSSPDTILSEGGKPPAKLVRVVHKVSEKNKVTVRKPDPKRLKEELQLMKSLWTSAWAANWSNIAPNDKEIDQTFDQLKDVFEPELARFGMIEGKEVGFFLAMPDLNQAQRLAYPHPGEPEIVTLLKLVWHWKVRNRVKGQRILLMGVKPEYRRLGVDAAMCLAFTEQGLKNKYWDTDAGWILETNQPMNQLMVTFHAKIYKKYRFYDMPLG